MPQQPRRPKPLAKPAEVAEYVRRTEGTLANWRCDRIGPPYLKVEGQILYDWDAVHAWLDSQAVTPEGRSA